MFEYRKVIPGKTKPPDLNNCTYDLRRSSTSGDWHTGTQRLGVSIISSTSYLTGLDQRLDCKVCY